MPYLGPGFSLLCCRRKHDFSVFPESTNLLDRIALSYRGKGPHHVVGDNRFPEVSDNPCVPPWAFPWEDRLIPFENGLYLYTFQARRQASTWLSVVKASFSTQRLTELLIYHLFIVFPEISIFSKITFTSLIYSTKLKKLKIRELILAIFKKQSLFLGRCPSVLWSMHWCSYFFPLTFRSCRKNGLKSWKMAYFWQSYFCTPGS